MEGSEKTRLLDTEANGGFTVVELQETTSGGDTGNQERVEQAKSMSASAAILGTIAGNEEAKTYLTQRIAQVNGAVCGTLAVGSVIVLVVEGATGSLDYNGWAWAANIIIVYTSSASTYANTKLYYLVALSYQIDRLRGQVTRLSEEVDRLAPEVDKLTKENDRYTGLLERHAAMQAEMESIVTQFASQHEELAQDAEEIDAAVEGLEKLKMGMEKLFPKVNDLVGDLRGQVLELTGQVDELTGQVDELEGQVDELEGQVKELTGQIDELGEQVDALEKTKQGLQASVGMLGQLQGEADKQGKFDELVNQRSGQIVEEQRELQKKREALQTQQEELLEKERGLIRQLEEHAAKLEKLESLQKIVADSALRKVALSAEVKQLTKERNAAKAAARHLATEKITLERRVSVVEEDDEEDTLERVASSAGVVLRQNSDEDGDVGPKKVESVV